MEKYLLTCYIPFIQGLLAFERLSPLLEGRVENKNNNDVNPLALGGQVFQPA